MNEPERAERAGPSAYFARRTGAPPAEAALLPRELRRGELGDVIAAVNGRRAETPSTFVAELDRVGVDNVAELTVEGEGRPRRVRRRVVNLRR